MPNILKIKPQTKRKRRPSSSRRKLVIIICAVVLVVVSAAGAWWWVNRQSQSGNKEEKKQEVSRKVHDVNTEVESAVAAGDSEKISQTYQQAAEQATSQPEKALVKLNEAIAYDRIGDNKKVLEAAREADRLDGEKRLVANTEELVATAAYELNDFPVALEYYKRMRDRFIKDPPGLGDPLPELNDRIAELEEKVK